MDLQLNGRVAFVAGSSKGIGRAIALSLLREGCRVCISGRNQAALDTACAELRTKFGEMIIGVSGDLTQTAAISDALDTIGETWHSPDILVANVGNGSGKPGWDLDDSEWERLFNLNLFGSIRLAQTVIPRMKSRGGNILFVSSIAGLEASSAPLPYSAAKAALVNYSKNLSRAVAREHIRVNCICPGNIFFPGGSWERHLANRREEVEKFISSEVPQQRFGAPEEVADLATFLVSPVSAFVTGAVYVIDGGQTHSVSGP
jgi:3-oxoacyl-[acyl-carrier protein] reductase